MSNAWWEKPTLFSLVKKIGPCRSGRGQGKTFLLTQFLFILSFIHSPPSVSCLLNCFFLSLLFKLSFTSVSPFFVFISDVFYTTLNNLTTLVSFTAILFLVFTISLCIYTINVWIFLHMEVHQARFFFLSRPAPFETSWQLYENYIT